MVKSHVVSVKEKADSVTKYQLRGEILWTEIIDNDCHIGVMFSEEKDFDVWVADVENMYHV